jgi:hypothetical protein
MSMKEDDALESRRATECIEVELKQRHTSKLKLPAISTMEPREDA